MRHPITIQVQDPNTERWTDLWRLHALKVNKAGGGQSANAGADQYTATLTFEVRFFKGLEALQYKPQRYRVVYNGHTFKLVDYDDFMEQHRTIKLVGVAYG